MMRISFLITILVVIFGLSIGCASTPQELKGSIQIKGSDTMVNLAQAWAEAFTKKYPNVNIAVTGGGSGTGIASMISGTCDIAISSRTMKEKEISQAKAKGVEPVEHIVARDGIAVVVHPSNPVKNLTIEELRAIFIGERKNWKEVGGKDAKIVILSREVNSGTHVFFKEHILRRGIEKGPEEFAPTALLMPSSQAIADEVAQNSNAIGYYGMGYISPEQKVIAVSKDKALPYLEPTTEAVKKGEYPIARPLFIYTKGAPQGAIAAFMDFVFSQDGQKIVRDIDFVPIK